MGEAESLDESELEEVSEQLNERQRVFVQEYLLDLNATKAAIRAGYAVSSAGRHAHKLLKNAYIDAAIQVAQSQRSKRTGITADRVLTELALIAFSDISDVVQVVGGELSIRDLEPMSKRVKRAIESVSEKPGEHGTARSVKMHSKLTALKMLADHLGLSADTVSKVQLTGKDGGPVETDSRIRYVIAVPKDDVESAE